MEIFTDVDAKLVRGGTLELSECNIPQTVELSELRCFSDSE